MSLWLVTSASAQLMHRPVELRHLSLPDQSIQFHISEKILKVKPVESLVYYWVQSGKLHHSKGGYHGDLLHGRFTSFFLDKQLRSQGMFKKGLKDNLWKTWYNNGELKSIGQYRNGLLHGSYRSYDENGNLEEDVHYKNGHLHGKILKYSDGELSEELKYKRGEVVETEPEVEAPADSLSREHELLEMITPEEPEESTEVEPVKKRKGWLKRILPKRKAKEEKEEETPNPEESPDA